MSSPPPLAVFPNAELVLTRYLRARLSGVRVATEWPSSVAGSLPLVSLSRSGGATVLERVTEDVTVDIDILAATKGAAQDLAQQVRGHLFQAPHEQADGALVYRVRDISLIWLPWQADASTDPIPRYVLVMQLRLRAL